MKNKCSSRRRHRRSRYNLMSEINITPFVDVVLVLLVIFMVSAPLLVNGVPIDLPEMTADHLNADTEPLTVSIAEDGRIAIKEAYYPREEFSVRLKTIGTATPEGFRQRIVIRGAKTASYEKVLDILSLIQKAGFHNVALATVPVK
ncbi:MAG: biopolymer transport protein TolR [Candidatus Tokpelaia sp. JSC188]|nr:MAG: biopolymer transport protein TolR [Candidatus Tokpelaia sp. JSC188]